MSDRFLTPSKYLDPEEVKKFRRCLDRTERAGKAQNLILPVRDSVMLHTILGAGLRVSEAANLTLNDLYLQYSESKILVNNSKRGKSRIVNIGLDLKKRLKSYLTWKRKNGQPMTKHDFVFLTRHGTKCSIRSIQDVFSKYLNQADIKKDAGIHSLRHTFAVLLYKSSGNNLRMVQKQLGHASPQTTQIYADVMDSDTQKAVDGMFSTEKSSKKSWVLDTDTNEEEIACCT